MDKIQFRKYALFNRNSIENKEQKSRIIAKETISFCKKYNKIGIYLSLEDEVKTDDIISELIKNNKDVYAPKIKNNDLVFYKIDSLDDVNINKFHIREPIESVVGEDIEVMIVPGVAFDRRLNRLGFGKGYYDRYLSNFIGIKIGIGFAKQLFDEIPIDNNDIKMDLIITEEEIIRG